MSDEATEELTPGQKLGEAFEPVDRRLHRIDWWPIVKKEFADTIRSRALLIYATALLAIFVLPIVLGLYANVGGIVQGLSALLLTGQIWLITIVVPLAAIGFGYAAVSGERQSNTIKLLLSQPYDRRDVILGKVVGRFFAVAAPFVVVMLLQIVSAAPSGGELPSLTNYALLVGLSVLLALVFVSFSIGASAATTTGRRSLLVAGGIWAYLFLLWNSVASGIPQLWNDTFGLGDVAQTEMLLGIKLFNPSQAFQTLLRSFTGASEAEARASMVGNLFLEGQAGLMQRQRVFQQLGEDVPFYLSDGAAVAVLVFWIVVPLYVGYVYFRGADL